MIAPKNLAEGTEFVVTIVVSAVAGLLAFLFVSLVVNMLMGLSGGHECGKPLECADLSAL